jgi:hypothetical protein
LIVVLLVVVVDVVVVPPEQLEEEDDATVVVAIIFVDVAVWEEGSISRGRRSSPTIPDDDNDVDEEEPQLKLKPLIFGHDENYQNPFIKKNSF